MADSVLRDRAKEFAKTVVFLCRDMKANNKESVLINQLLRSSTSIGANLHEAQYAQGTKDFISKLEIAQKECYETEYRLELLFETNCMNEENAQVIYDLLDRIKVTDENRDDIAKVKKLIEQAENQMK